MTTLDYKNSKFRRAINKTKLKLLVSRVFGLEAKITAQTLLSSSSLSHVEVISIEVGKLLTQCIVKLVHDLWSSEPNRHLTAKDADPDFIPNVLAVVSTGGYTLYMQEFIAPIPCDTWSASIVKAASHAMCDFYMKAETYNYQQPIKWLDIITQPKKKSVSKLTELLASHLGRNRLLSISILRSAVVETLELSQTEYVPTIIHNDLHAGQFLMKKDGTIALTDWGFSVSGHPLADVASILRDEPDGRNDALIKFRDSWLMEFQTYGSAIFGCTIKDEELDLWRRWQCLRDLLWFTTRQNHKAAYNDPLDAWSTDSALEFQMLVTHGTGSWKLEYECWAINKT